MIVGGCGGSEKRKIRRGVGSKSDHIVGEQMDATIAVVKCIIDHVLLFVRQTKGVVVIRHGKVKVGVCGGEGKGIIDRAPAGAWCEER